MFEYRYHFIWKELITPQDRSAFLSALAERDSEWDQRTAAGDLDGRPVFVGVDEEGNKMYQGLVKNIDLVRYMEAQTEELRTRFSIPNAITFTYEPNTD